MKHKRLLLHIAFWGFYILFKTSQNVGSELAPLSNNLSIQDILPLFYAQLTLLLIKIPMVYAFFFIIDKYLEKTWSLLLSIFCGISILILCLIAYFPLRNFIILNIYHLEYSPSKSYSFVSIISALFILLFIASLAISIKAVRINIKQRAHEQALIKHKLESELQFLKAQTKPHFLFNTLNNIYALARKKSDDTADVVMKLSKLLRFMLYESHHKFITIRQEVQVLQDYIELEKIRFYKKLDLNFTREIDNLDQAIAPLILLPFVENAFKHGASESLDESFIHISLNLKSGILHFSVINSKNEIPEEINGDHLGLKNIKRQLELQYKIHELWMENNSNDFKVSLMINLNSHA
ncbi:MAG: histidine kinase [Saprospiraceae bacterium]|nr:histidine kinase [Saprospiraceae bacterium]MBK8632137.1 histidine kinase [Saprospiraceae bacterium]